jgi:hypothetical protein
VTELVDVPVLGTGVIWRVGSSPTKGKYYFQQKNIYIFFYKLYFYKENKIISFL